MLSFKPMANPTPLNILILFAHPNTTSFNSRILDELTQTLQSAGHTLKIRDLYRENIKVTLDHDDLSALKTGTTPPDIKQQQDELTWAQGVIFVYPVWWFGPPAILKGWMDRTFQNGFAFTFDRETGTMKGLLHHLRALVVMTNGSDKPAEGDDTDTLIQQPLVKGLFEFVGVENVTTKALYAVNRVSDEDRAGMLDEVRTLADKMFSDPS